MFESLFAFSDHLGFFNPFYFVDKKGSFVIRTSFEDIVKAYGEPLEFDPVAVTEFLSNRFILGDRTIVKGIFRTPWMAHPDDSNKQWVFHDLPPHKENELTEEKIAEELFKQLCEEIKIYVGSSKSVGILLSGGMDSRMVAGVLDHLMKNGEVSVERVVAYTWGNADSRDVIYAERIARILNWEWKHYPVSAEDLYENFKIAGIRGCEYSGIHLHALPQIATDMDVDICLAGSYGDSVGRAEYAGRNVTKLIPIDSRMWNFAYLLKSQIFNSIKEKWKNDTSFYYEKFPRDEDYAQNELDQELHYMRRLLNPCMEILNEKAPTYQAFTSPKVFGFMWSHKPELRNDKVYEFLIKYFTPELREVPWARTGLIYGKLEGVPDKYNRKHHTYEDFIKNDLLGRIENDLLIFNSGSDIFNEASIQSLLNQVKKNSENNNDYTERLTWLVSISYFLKHYNFKRKDFQSLTLRDQLNAKLMLSAQYKAITKLRKLKNKL